MSALLRRATPPGADVVLIDLHTGRVASLAWAEVHLDLAAPPLRE